MRVLHLDSGRSMRGGQWQALALLRGLRLHGMDLRLAARGDLAEAAASEGIPVVPLSLANLPRLRGWADVVHAHDARSHTLAALAGLRPLVVARRVAFPIRAGIFSAWKYRRADRFLAISEAVQEQLLHAGTPPSRIRVVHDGVALGAEPESREDIVALASDDPGKCNGLIHEAAAAGGFEVCFSKDLPQAFTRARAFLYLSTAEGLGSAALLAMGRGVPVVASRIPGLSEVVVHEETGFLVDNNPAEVAAAVQLLLSDAALAEGLGKKGRLRVQERFSEEMMVERTIAAYEGLR